MKSAFPYYRGATGPDPKDWVKPPPVPADPDVLPRGRRDDPAGYNPGAELEAAVNAALLLGMPLVVTGRPGCGKTQLGPAVAHALGWLHLRFDTKSTSIARDIFYDYDMVGRFREAQIEGQAADPLDFVSYRALGLAILLSRPHSEAAEFMPPGRPPDLSALADDRRTAVAAAWPAQGFRTVVVIDEVDKAPRDFPNDILNEIDRFEFAVPETGSNRRIKAADALRPFVLFTSNSERQLPDAFLRRCAYHDIRDPDETRLKEIIEARIGDAVPGGSALSAGGVKLYASFQPGGATPLKKPPGIAELLNWLQGLAGMGADIGQPLAAQDWRKVSQSLALLVKTRDDRTGLGYAEAEIRKLMAQ